MWTLGNQSAGNSQAGQPGTKIGHGQDCPLRKLSRELSRELTGPGLVAAVQPPSRGDGGGLAREGYEHLRCGRVQLGGRHLQVWLLVLFLGRSEEEVSGNG